MSRHNPIRGLLAFSVTLAVLAGCHPQQPFYLNDRGQMDHYKKAALEIEYPDVQAERLGDVDGATPPMTLNNLKPKEFWDLTLEQAVQHALANSKVMRELGGVVTAGANGNGPGTPDFLLRQGGQSAGIHTIYDPAITESDPMVGVEAAMAAFDAHFGTTMLWEKGDKPVNTTSNQFFRPVQQTDTGAFTAQLAKTNAWGGTTKLTHHIQYEDSNSPLRVYPSDWNTTLDAEIRQPLLRGAGVEFNRISTPLDSSQDLSIVQGPGRYSGVMIARVNTDIALASFEAGVRNMVADVENAYWELYFTYRAHEAAQQGLESNLKTWQKIYALAQAGAKGGEAEREAQAREQYFQFRAATERAMNALHKAEANLRYMMGIAVADGRLIRPSDEPTTAKVSFDWNTIHSEALVRSVELRQQKWLVKRYELELIGAKNFLMPKLDVVGNYRWRGLGDDLVGYDNRQANPPTDPYPYSYNEMLDGNFQDWRLGLEFRMPLGFRREMAGVRNAQLLLAKQRAILQDQELELSHQVAAALRDLEANFILCQTNFNRTLAAQRNVEAVKAAYETDTVTIDVLLNAQKLLAQAQSEYFRTLVDYNRSIINVHFRKGSLLEYNGVYLAEGPWPAKAYFDACKLARARAAGHYLDFGYTKPRVSSAGVYEQHAGQGTVLPPGTTVPPGAMESILPDSTPTPGTPEVVPAPTPAKPPAPPVPQPSSTTGGKASGPQLLAPQVSLPPAGAKTASGKLAVGASGQQSAVSSQGSAVSSQGKTPSGTLAAGTSPSKRYDGDLAAGLGALAEAASPSGAASNVQPASYQAQSSTSGWSSVNRPSNSNVPQADLPNPQPDRSSAGWARAQR